MEKYKRKALEKNIKGLEYSDVQKSIIINHRRKYKHHRGLYTFVVSVLFLLTVFIVNINQGDDFYIVRVNANDFVINSFQNGVPFTIHTLVENDTIVYNEDYSYYKDMQALVDISDQANMSAYDFGKIKLLEFRIGDNVRFFEVFENGDYITIKQFNYDVQDLISVADELSNMLEKYPPIEEIDDSHDYLEKHNFNINSNINEYGNNDLVELYKTYVRRMSYWIQKNNYEVNSFGIKVMMSGNEDEPGEITVIGTMINCGPLDLNYNTNPLIVNDDVMTGLTYESNIDSESGIEYHYYTSLSSIKDDVGYGTLILIFDNSNYNPYEISVKMTKGGTNELIDDIYISDNIMYIFPQKHFSEKTGVTTIESIIDVYHDDLVIFSFRDCHSHYTDSSLIPN